MSKFYKTETVPLNGANSLKMVLLFIVPLGLPYVMVLDLVILKGATRICFMVDTSLYGCKTMAPFIE